MERSRQSGFEHGTAGKTKRKEKTVGGEVWKQKEPREQPRESQDHVEVRKEEGREMRLTEEHRHLTKE